MTSIEFTLTTNPITEQASHADEELTSTTTSDDDLLNYHAQSQLDSDSCSLPSRYGRRRHRLRSSRGRRMLEGACPSSSQSSSDLSSPNETCYSFVRRALAKFSSSTRSSWDDSRQRCRPWFVASPPASRHSPTSHNVPPLYAQDSGESIENAADLPIELRDVDAPPSETDTPPNSPVKNVDSPPLLNHKSKSLSDLLSLFTAGLLRGPNSRKGSQDGGKDDKKLGRSKSSHTHLTKVEENVDESSGVKVSKVSSSPKRPPEGVTTEPCRRPRSLIILNAEDHRNGNTILPDMDVQNEGNVFDKRASWPVVPKKISIFQNEFPPLHSEDNGQRDSGVEDLSNGGKKKEEVKKGSAMTVEVKERHHHHHHPRLKRHLVKQMENIDQSNREDVVRDLVYEEIIRHIMAQAKLFPSHSMPDLHASNRSLYTKSHRSVTVASVILRNGFKGRSSFRRKDSLVAGVLNGCCLVKRSLSLDNSGERGAFEPREKVYCNRITKEDSLQRDTSYDSDDSVASVIAVAPREPGTTSDTSLDSEDSCISVIAMPTKEATTTLILSPLPPPDVLQSAKLPTPTTPAGPDVVSAASPTAEDPNCDSTLPDLVRRNIEDIPEVNVEEPEEKEIRSPVFQIPMIIRATPPISRCSSEGTDDVQSEITSDRKVLRKAGSLPEHGEPRQDTIVGRDGLLTQPAVALSASADATLGGNGKRTDRISVAEWGVSGDSLSSSRSSSNSSISWEKFLDASRSVVLDNIAMVSAGSDVVLRSGKGSVAILKNASHRSHVLREYASKHAAKNGIPEDQAGIPEIQIEQNIERTPSPLLQAAAEVANSLHGAVAAAVGGEEEGGKRADGDSIQVVGQIRDNEDVEYKEAGVQTSLILYSTQSDEQRTPASPRNEDALNGNLPQQQIRRNESLTSSSIDRRFAAGDGSEEIATADAEEEAAGAAESNKCLNCERSLSASTSDESLQCGGDVGGSLTFHRYYHVFREGELDQLIEKYVENLHIISSYYDHANWCVIAEKVQVWRI